ncbi:cell wall hydrolase [Bacillus sp. FJAT-49736]|uniref:cell wall hydrolase n=1 Tax=Bacillus sp. FJAT-49736 TaxID=2833582 RepID=UPI001BC98E27|nr:cell wall hydrolase [Bacillus sp. FJAT-49736]MBS4171842.1 cell wall hydrolase [Bacillus sp. FJAT-49736]
MNKLKKLLLATGLIASMSTFALTNQSDAATSNYKVQKGETYWKIANKFGVSVNSLMEANHAKNSNLNVGQSIIIPNSAVSSADKDLMARLVHAEAVGEPYAGKVAVATVVLNRVKDSNFPSTIKGVIYQIESGHYAFTPVQNGRINQQADAESKRAVNEAIAFNSQSQGSLYFYNPKTAKSSWIFSRKTTVTIGNHRFAK